MGARKSKKAVITETATSITSDETIVVAEPIPSSTARLPGDGLGVVVGKRELKALVARFTGVVDRKSTMPILANVSIRVDHTGMTMSATDLNVSMRVRVDACKVARTGSISVSQKRLADVIKTLPDGDVSLYQERQSITIAVGSVKTVLEGMPDRDTPAFPRLEDETVWTTLPSAPICELFAAAKHAICTDDTRFHLNGVYFEKIGSVLRVVTTDGHRLVKAERTLDDAGDVRIAGVIIPRKGATEIGKLLAKSAECDVLVTKSHAWIRQASATLVVKLTDAQFPPYEQVIPKGHKRLVVVDSEALAGALKRASATCAQTRGARLSLASGKLVVSADDGEGAGTREELDAEYTCDACEIGVNPSYLIDALDQIADRAVIALGEPSKTKEGPAMLDPMLVRSLDDAAMRSVMDAHFLGVVMPMRI